MTLFASLIGHAAHGFLITPPLGATQCDVTPILHEVDCASVALLTDEHCSQNLAATDTSFEASTDTLKIPIFTATDDANPNPQEGG